MIPVKAVPYHYQSKLLNNERTAFIMPFFISISYLLVSPGKTTLRVRTQGAQIIIKIHSEL